MPRDQKNRVLSQSLSAASPRKGAEHSRMDSDSDLADSWERAAAERVETIRRYFRGEISDDDFSRAEKQFQLMRERRQGILV